MIRGGYEPGIAIPPGETLQEYLDTRGMTQAELAKRLGLVPKTINEIVKGKAPISPATALALESVFGTPARFWVSLEANSQETKACLEGQRSVAEDIEIARLFPYAALVQIGAVAATRKPGERVINLRGFFGVAQLGYVPALLPAAFRRQPRDTASPHALAAWLRVGELMSAKVETEPFNAQRLRSLLATMRSLALNPEAEDVPGRLKELCASAGVALVFVPRLPRTYVNGATRWVSSDKVLVQLSLSPPYADVIWFNLFHEIGHVLLHAKKEVYITEESNAGQSDQDEREREADRFASEGLLPNTDYRRYLQKNKVTSITVRQFARDMGIHPCVVVGRLQHDKKLPFSRMNDLRPRLSWKPDRLGCE